MNHTKTKKGAWDEVFAKVGKKPDRPPPAREGGLCYGYFRVSTQRQAEEGHSLDAQKAAIAKYAREKGLGEVLFFVDPGVSASKIPLADREAGRVLVERVRPGDRVVIPTIDRGFRNFADFIRWHDAWTTMGVNLHVINLYGQGTMDSSTASGRLLFRTVASFAAFESEMNGERVKSAIDAKRASGLLWNRYAPPGFKAKKVARGYIAVPDPVARRLMGTILAWYDEGQTLHSIADHLTRHEVPFIGRLQKQWNHVRVLEYIRAERKLRAREDGQAS